jgi:hypothetical protein
VLSAWPAIAFVGSAEVAFGMVRKSAQTATEPDSVPATETAAVAAVIPDIQPDVARTLPRSLKTAKPVRRAAAIVRANPDVSGAELGRKLGVSERQGRRLLAQVASS